MSGFNRVYLLRDFDWLASLVLGFSILRESELWRRDERVPLCFLLLSFWAESRWHRLIYWSVPLFVVCFLSLCAKLVIFLPFISCRFPAVVLVWRSKINLLISIHTTWVLSCYIISGRIFACCIQNKLINRSYKLTQALLNCLALKLYFFFLY